MVLLGWQGLLQGDFMTRSARAWLTGAAGLLGLLAACAYEWGRRHASPGADEPPPRFVSPFLNARLNVSYVGTARCAGCHPKEASTYAEHPMGRSVRLPGQWLPAQEGAASSFQASGLSYAVERRADGVTHKEFASGIDGRAQAEVAATIAFTIGSGRQGQSFLLNRGGYLFLSPISWYSHENAWQLSPGYARVNQHFDRYVMERCLFCHVNEACFEPDSLNRSRSPRLELESIGCERCHGPGALHVAAHEDGERRLGEDLTIVNPRRLDPPLREAVCEQCHVLGEARIVRRGHSPYDYRPGLPLQEFISIYVRPPGQADARAAVSQAEQIRTSRCFRASGGKMGCISCHDPHALPPAPQRVSWYRGRCLNCHQDTSCALAPHDRRRQNVADSCIDCHMPHAGGSTIAHSTVTDHRIPRRADRTRLVAAVDEPGTASLVLFPNGRSDQAGGENARDLGLALVELAGKPHPEMMRRHVLRQACSLLREEVARTPDDVPALEGLGVALWEARASREALATLEKVVVQAPRRELALEKAARAAMQLGDTERSLGYWQRLAELNPYSAEGRAFLAQVLAMQRRWAAAVEECRASLRLNPFDHRPRMLLIDCLVRLGKEQQARKELDVLVTVLPAKAAEVRRWFDRRRAPSR
jgi:hypothetical protein